MDTKESLTAEWIRRDDAFWGIIVESEQSIFSRTGASAVFCHGYAEEIQHRLGIDRVVIEGFWLESNPGSKIAMEAGGHDFAIVDGRWIVDPWLIVCSEFNERGVFDLHDEDDAAEIASLYGDRSMWENQSDTPAASTSSTIARRSQPQADEGT